MSAGTAGGSVMLAVPPALLDVLHLSAGVKVGLAVDNGHRAGHRGPRLQRCRGGLRQQPQERTCFTTLACLVTLLRRCRRPPGTG